MNEYDSNRILDITKEIQYEPTTDKTNADCYIINTCHIREKDVQKKFSMILDELKKVIEIKPIVIITGCVAQAEGDLILQKEKYVDAVVGPQSYQIINKIIEKVENKKTFRRD